MKHNRLISVVSGFFLKMRMNGLVRNYLMHRILKDKIRKLLIKSNCLRSPIYMKNINIKMEIDRITLMGNERWMTFRLFFK